MRNFTYYVPTEVEFGKDTEHKVADLIQKHGGHRVLVVYGGGSAQKSGLLDRIYKRLEDAGLEYQSLGGVKPNPTVDLARKGVEQAIAMKADFILAVGGGSVIDTAKGIAHGNANPGTDIWDFWTGTTNLRQSTPVGVVLTIPAAGSETSASAVLTNTEIGQKRGLSSEFNRPVFAILNPELTFTLPLYQVACGITDILMHTLDRYFVPEEDNETSDALAEALLRTVIRNGTIAIKNPQDYQAMSELMWCGSLSHNSITGLGSRGDWAVHQLGHELSAKFDVAHGASLSAMWKFWALYVYQVNPRRFARYARNVWAVDAGRDDEQTALASIEATVAYFKSLGMPTNFKELGIGTLGDAELDELAYRCTYFGARTIGNFMVLDQKKIRDIYSLANQAV
ncbi:iron-containing alcohol dehydrogenase [Gracilinema caldarium]|uniref:Alcohol dehydrogenase (NADP(+)) n=1 Tax=Gracilinema caldarium (strain ATCC 51460 / DSM 7334 / H1) TaxID=744872 RepID=F8EZB5_GRAC1|nr:iron-containing alcohol dehydrogenase [Gracilinema caldarium]AEJ19707.1 Alcohol dehydrogenase (NADP(+)) [Gracilinema caldarium DSM 7334]